MTELMYLAWIKKLGEGAFGQVHLVKNKNSGDLSALKLIKVSQESELKSASSEMAHHQRAAASSEYVVNVHAWSQVGDDFLFVLMEYCSGGDIDQLLTDSAPPRRRKRMADDTLRWKLYKQICIGLDAIHKAGLIHMDLKPANGKRATCRCHYFGRSRVP